MPPPFLSDRSLSGRRRVVARGQPSAAAAPCCSQKKGRSHRRRDGETVWRDVHSGVPALRRAGTRGEASGGDLNEAARLIGRHRFVHQARRRQVELLHLSDVFVT